MESPGNMEHGDGSGVAGYDAVTDDEVVSVFGGAEDNAVTVDEAMSEL